MHTTVNGHHVPIDIARGLGHQIVRKYAEGSAHGYSWPAGTTTQGLPWFRNFKKAADYLEGKPYPGYIQSYVLSEDGTTLSSVTAGAHYHKVAGDSFGPLESIELRLDPTEDNADQLRLLCDRVSRLQVIGNHGEPSVCVAYVTTSEFSACFATLRLGHDSSRARAALETAQAYDVPRIQLFIVENQWWESASPDRLSAALARG